MKKSDNQDQNASELARRVFNVAYGPNKSIEENGSTPMEPFLELAGRVFNSSDAHVQSILSWNGHSKSFFEKVADPVEKVIDKVAKDHRVAPLYRTWSALLEKQQHLRDGHIHLMWNILDSQKMRLSDLEGWKNHVEPVLMGTFSAMWPEMRLVMDVHPPEEEKWYESVFAAMRNGMRDPDAFDAFDALVELVARVFLMDEDGVKGEWAAFVAESARAYTMRAKCLAPESDAPISIQELLREYSNNTEMAQRDASRIVLSLRACTIEQFTKNADPFNELARRIVNALAAEAGYSPKVTESEVAEFIRHLAFEERSPIASLLARCTGYQPYVRPISNHPVEHMDNLELNIMLIGRTEVGKSAFLFASERLPTAGESKEPNPQEGTYPRIDLKHVAGENLESDRSKWAELLPTRDTFYKLYAETEPFGLYSFNIMDAPGEIVGRSAARRGSEYFDFLPLQIQRLRPSVLALMLGHESDNENEDNTHFQNGIERSVRSISKILENDKLKQLKLEKNQADAKLSELIASYPVYVIQNQADKLIASLRCEQKDNSSKEIEDLEEGYRADLAKKIGQHAFSLGPYFENAKTIDDSIHEMRSDNSLALGDPALRDLVVKTFEDRKLFFNILRGAGFRNVNLVFVSSLPEEMVERHSQHVGVEAFWRHLWTETTMLFAGALEKAAQRLLVDDLKDVAQKIGSRCETNLGISLPAVPFIDESAMLNAFSSLIKNEDTIINIRQNFNPGRKLRDQMINMSDGWRMAMKVVDKFEGDVKAFMKSWSLVLHRLIAELNIPPDISCGEIRAEELTKGEIDWLQYARAQLAQNSGKDEDIDADSALQKRIAESDIHGFFGSLRHSSILREIFETKTELEGIENDALKWLDIDPGKSLFQRVESDLGRDVKNGKILECALRLVSDWGFDFAESKRDLELEPNYQLLAIRRYERNRSLFQFHFRANNAGIGRSPADRIERVIDLIRRMGDIRTNLDSLNGLQTEIRPAVEGLALSMMLRSLKFDVEKIKENESSKEVLTEVENNLRRALNKRVFLLFDDRRTVREVIQLQENNLDNQGFRIAGDGLIFPISTSNEACRAAYNIAAFSQQAVEVAERTGNLIALEDDKEGVSFVIGTLMSKLGKLRKAVDSYQREMISYLEMTLRIFLDMHHEFVLQTGLVEKDDSNTRMMLSRIVNQEFDSVKAGIVNVGIRAETEATDFEVAGQTILKNQQLQRQKSCIDDFADRVQALIRSQNTKPRE